MQVLHLPMQVAGSDATFSGTVTVDTIAEYSAQMLV